MINEKEYAKNIIRIRQEYDTRLDKTRLGMNEYVEHMPEELFKEIMLNFDIEKASAYPEVNLAYSALAKYLNRSRECLILTSGADMALRVVYDTFCNDGDVIITCAPTFAMYEIYSLLHNCLLAELECDENGDFSITHLVEQLQLTNAKAVILANPNGVTGYCFNKESVELLLQESVRRGILVVIDETYGEFDAIDMSCLIDKYDNLIIIRSFSKCIGMAGLRIGYILASEDLVAMMEKFRPMMEINSLAVEAVKTVCNNTGYIDNARQVILKMRKYLSDNLEIRGYKTIVKNGNFVLVDFGDGAKEIEQKLKAGKIEFKKLGNPLDKYFRFTVGTKNTMDQLLFVLDN